MHSRIVRRGLEIFRLCEGSESFVCGRETICIFCIRPSGVKMGQSLFILYFSLVVAGVNEGV